MTLKKILVVDDEAGIRALLHDILHDEGYRVYIAENAESARLLRAKYEFDVILLDIWMPDCDGISLLKEWRKNEQLNAPIIMMSGHGTLDMAIEAIRIGAFDFLEKPISMQRLINTLQRAIADVSESFSVSINDNSLVKKSLPFNLDQDFRSAKEDFERLYLNYHLQKTSYNITKLSEIIGVDRTYLYRKLKLLKIEQTK